MTTTVAKRPRSRATHWVVGESPEAMAQVRAMGLIRYVSFGMVGQPTSSFFEVLVPNGSGRGEYRVAAWSH